MIISNASGIPAGICTPILDNKGGIISNEIINKNKQIPITKDFNIPKNNFFILNTFFVEEIKTPSIVFIRIVNPKIPIR